MPLSPQEQEELELLEISLLEEDLAQSEPQQQTVLQPKAQNFLESQAQIGARGLNTMLLGAPQMLAEKAGLETDIFDKPKGIFAEAQDFTTQMASLIGGGVGKIGATGAKIAFAGAKSLPPTGSIMSTIFPNDSTSDLN